MTGDELLVHVRKKNARLERDVAFMAAERERLERLLAAALDFAAQSIDVDPLALLCAVATAHGERLERAAFVADAQLEQEFAWYESLPARLGVMEGRIAA